MGRHWRFRWNKCMNLLHGTCHTHICYGHASLSVILSATWASSYQHSTAMPLLCGIGSLAQRCCPLRLLQCKLCVACQKFCWNIFTNSWKFARFTNLNTEESGTHVWETRLEFSTVCSEDQRHSFFCVQVWGPDSCWLARATQEWVEFASTCWLPDLAPLMCSLMLPWW